MEHNDQNSAIVQLIHAKKELKVWRWSLAGGLVLAAYLTVSMVHAAFKGLTTKGPAQDKYVALMTEAFHEELGPMVQDMGQQTLTELKPEVEQAFDNVNKEMPEVAQAALNELAVMQENLPKRAEAVLTDTFGKMLVEKEDELNAMFPEATHEQIERLLTNLGESASYEAENAALEIFGKHHEAMENITANLELISAQEQKHLTGVDPTWEMGLLVLDMFREEAYNNRPDKNLKETSKSVGDIKNLQVKK